MIQSTDLYVQTNKILVSHVSSLFLVPLWFVFAIVNSNTNNKVRVR